MSQVIFGLSDPRTRRFFHVGCCAEADLESRAKVLPKAAAARVAEMSPAVPHIDILQTVEKHPLATWVKWCLRFERDLVTDDHKQHHELVEMFSNSHKLRRALGENLRTDVDAQDRFHEFDRKNPELFDKMLRIARELKDQGCVVNGLGTTIFGQLRHSDTKTNRIDQFKISQSHSPFYARKLQMVDPSLCGLFAMRESVADDLVLEDGRTWRDFAKEHGDKIRIAALFEFEEDDDVWTY